jgi:hypothetical protein
MTSYLSALSRIFGQDHGSINVVLDDREEVNRAGLSLYGRVVLNVHRESSGGKVEVELIGREKTVRKKGPVDM